MIKQIQENTQAYLRICTKFKYLEFITWEQDIILNVTFPEDEYCWEWTDHFAIFREENIIKLDRFSEIEQLTNKCFKEKFAHIEYLQDLIKLVRGEKAVELKEIDEALTKHIWDNIDYAEIKATVANIFIVEKLN